MNFVRCFIFMAITGIIAFFVGRVLPKRWLNENGFPYKPYAFEKDGDIYEKIGIRKWQNKMLDMSRILPKMMPTKRLEGNMLEKLPVMIKETCIAELIHTLLGLIALNCLFIWKGAGGIIVTILYEIGNLPYILIQRYNRPRLIALFERLQKRANVRTLQYQKGELTENANVNIKLQYR